MDHLENPFKPLEMPDFWRLVKKGLTVDQATLHRHTTLELISEQNAYWAAKPTGDVGDYLKEEDYYDRLTVPPVLAFEDQVPSGVSYSDHFRFGLPQSLLKLITEVRKGLGAGPTCAIVEDSVAHLIEMAFSFSRPLSVPFDHTARSSVGKLFSDTIDVHREPACEPPYMLPAGEMWLMLAWRYDMPEKRRTEWARPVGILRFDEFTDTEMVHIARCARVYKSYTDLDRFTSEA